MMDRQLLAELLHDAPHQPATQIFRVPELSHLLQSGVLPLHGDLLDFGCGDGRILQLIQRKLGAQWRAVGFDPNAEEVELARGLGLYQRLHVAFGDAVPEPDATFDIVFSNSVLEHIPNIEPVLSEVARLLRPGGKFVFTTPGHGFHASLSGPGLTGWLATGERDRDRYLEALDRRVAHFRYWDDTLWKAKLEAAGLRLSHASWYLTPDEMQRWEALTNLTSGLLTRLRGGGRTPMEVQRDLGVRQSRVPGWMRAVGMILGNLFSLGLPEKESAPIDPATAGCVLIVAEK